MFVGLPVTDALPLRARHYEPEPALVRRTVADVSPEFRRARIFLEPFTERLLEPRPSNPRLVGSADGAIERLLLTIPAYSVRSVPLADVYRDLFAQLPGSVALVVLTHESVAGDVEGWLAGRDGAEIIGAPDHLHFSVWAEDGYVVITDQTGEDRFLVEPFSFPRYGDSLVADFVSNATELKKTQAPLYFQGGNVLIGDDFFLIGADYPANSLQYIGGILTPAPGETEAELIHRLYQEYLDTGRRLLYVASTIPVPEEQVRQFRLGGQDWTEVLHLGNRPGTAQPLFHIDMFITLLGRAHGGRYRVLVGDPKVAAEILDHPLQPHAMAYVFDNIAATLARLDFEVIRNPLPLVYVDDERRRERLWYFATSNNALVQATGDATAAVYMPTYGHGSWSSLTATDERNQQLWESLGFATHLLGDFHPFAENLGALHCIKKYLARGT
ncbi:MAG: hypothetical protein KY395_08135 [Actinobacteria bacterium]|nr:hypothetical protein [Actinomycetota bacterium]